MLNKKVIQKLNEQINHEMFASNLYLQMSAWCAAHGFEGAAGFLAEHAQEETEHMQRIFNYMIDSGEQPEVRALEAPNAKYKSLQEVFEKTLEHEIFVTKKINELVGTAMKENDYSAFQFLQWYVAEQHEEEKVFMSILDKFKLLGNDSKGLYFLDQELAGMVQKNPLDDMGGAETSTNPA